MPVGLAMIFVTFAGAGLLTVEPAAASPPEGVKATFRKFVAAENAHDLRAMGALLSDSPDFIWIAPGSVATTRDAALKRYEELFTDQWSIRPDWATYQSMMLDVSTAEIFVRGAAAKEGQGQPAAMNFVLINTPSGWRVLSIVVSRSTSG